MMTLVGPIPGDPPSLGSITYRVGLRCRWITVRLTAVCVVVYGIASLIAALA
jgi:hypothetical protein